MAVEPPEGSGVPYRARRGNQPVTLTRKAYDKLLQRLDALEREVEALKGHTHKYRVTGSENGRGLAFNTDPPTLPTSEKKDGE